MAKILVVDDDPDIVEMSRIVLEKEGHTVSEASCKECGLKAMETVQPDLLILDVMMEQPDDGIAMAQELRRNGCKTPILMLTGIGKVTGMNYGKDSALVPVDVWLDKPVGPNTLIAKVNELLNKKEA